MLVYACSFALMLLLLICLGFELWVLRCLVWFVVLYWVALLFYYFGSARFYCCYCLRLFSCLLVDSYLCGLFVVFCLLGILVVC